MVATVTISKAKDEKGQEIVPDIAFDVAAVAYVTVSQWSSLLTSY
jgi:hypothetical protein